MNIVHTADLPHLQQLTQVTALYMHAGGGMGAPIVPKNPPSAPLAALRHLKRLVLPWGWVLTGNTGDDDLNDYNCPLALPPNLTYLSVVSLECAPGSLWRHIGACTALEELEVTNKGEGAHSHPSWGLHELAGSLAHLKKLEILDWDVECKGNPVHRLAHLLRLLYLPDEDVEPEELDAALALAVPPVPVEGFDAAVAPHHMMLPPPNMAGFSSLEVLQLPNGAWWLMCCQPHHWQALAGCSALRELHGLHAAQPPPAGVKFPGVTRLEVTVAPGDAVRVLGAFPVLQKLKMTSIQLAPLDQVGVLP
jgi:hypothetical protein